MDPLARAKQVMFGYIQTQSLVAAVRLGVPDALQDGPMSIGDLAAAVDAPAETLGRLLDVLVRLGLFARDEDGRYGHNDASACLSTGHENSLADLILFCGRESYATFGNLDKAVQGNRGVFADAWGHSFWEHLRDNGDRGAMFGRAMERQSEQLLQALAQQHDFSAYGHICDVGGGKGQLFRPLIKAGVQSRCTVFDQPSVAPLSARFLSDEGLAERVTFVGGDFFESVPAGADLYILKFVLHDWSDDKALDILRSVKASMKPGSAVMVIELFRGGGPSPWSLLSDMLMLSTFGAKERSDAELRALLQEAGFAVADVQRIAGAHHYAFATA